MCVLYWRRGIMGDGRCRGRAWLEQSVNHCTATLDLASARCDTQTASRKQTALLTQYGPSRHQDNNEKWHKKIPTDLWRKCTTLMTVTIARVSISLEVFWELW